MVQKGDDAGEDECRGGGEAAVPRESKASWLIITNWSMVDFG